MTYQLHLTIRGDALPPITVDTDRDQLAQAVHRHARGMLGSRAVDVHLHDDLTGEIRNHGSPVGTFTLTLTEQRPPRRTDTPLHGHTPADIDDITRHVLYLDRWHAGDVEERHAAVRFAIVEHLCTSPEPPTRRDLIGIGLRASDRHVLREMHHHGWNADDIGAGRGAATQFQRYWQASTVPSPENAIVGRLAHHAIWPQLTPAERRALETLAEAGDYQLAAAALGIAVATLRVQLSQGRRRYLAWWHEGEIPSRPWRTDRRVYSRDGMWRGRARLTVSQVEALRGRYHAGETLTALAAEAGVHKSTLSELFRGGRSRPAADRPGGEAA